MKNFIGIAILAVLIVGGLLLLGHRQRTATFPNGPVGANPVTFTAANMATSSVGIYSWSSVLSADSSRTYVSFCNDSVIANSAIYLGLGATTTVSGLGMAGIKVPSNTCYEMTVDHMFYGTVYAIASSATSTLLKVSNSGY